MSDQNSSSACFDFFPVFSIEILLEVLAKEYFKSNIEDHQDGIWAAVGLICLFF